MALALPTQPANASNKAAQEGQGHLAYGNSMLAIPNHFLDLYLFGHGFQEDLLHNLPWILLLVLLEAGSNICLFSVIMNLSEEDSEQPHSDFCQPSHSSVQPAWCIGLVYAIRLDLPPLWETLHSPKLCHLDQRVRRGEGRIY